MKRWPATFVICFFLVLSGCGRGKVQSEVDVPAGVSWASLLAQANDLRTLAGPVAPSAASKMFSSCADTNKVLLANLAPQILGDMDHGFFTEVVDSPRGVTAKLAEFDGPGVVTWVWSANPVGVLSIFLDGQEQPALSLPFRDFLAGSFLPVRQPFSSVTSLGHNLHFPVVHAKHCKLMLSAPRRVDLSELFYQVAWQSLPRDANIQTFDVAAIKRESLLLRQLAQRQLAISRSHEPAMTNNVSFQSADYVIEPGQAVEVYRSPGPKAIVAMRFEGKSKSDIRSLSVEGIWDRMPSVHASLHGLAGVSLQMEDTQSLPATVAATVVTIRWFMPFVTDGRVVCSNSGARASAVKLGIWTQPIDPSEYPLRFHADDQRNHGLKTDASNVLTLMDAPGPGRIAGCVLGVDSRSDQWWGEGDPVIWLDDFNAPAWHGTGTEDYFGFAWCSQGVFQEPFRGQSWVDGTRSHRIAQMHRYHILDRLPFQQRARFQFEAWGLGKGEMDWTTTMLWYGTGGNR